MKNIVPVNENAITKESQLEAVLLGERACAIPRMDVGMDTGTDMDTGTSNNKKAQNTLPINPQSPWLAPLAGWSDLPFRLLCRELGATVCCTEMVSAKGLMYGSVGTIELLHTLQADTPLVVQLFGSEPDFMEAATRHLMQAGARFFDCNMGCAVPKVTRTGAGAAMGRDLDNAMACAKAMIDVAGHGRVGFKLRLGWDDKQLSFAELGPRLAEAGAGWLTLHPRTAKQGFSGNADWRAIKELKNMVNIPVIASGDLLTAAHGIRCLAQTGADAVMYGRGALRNPAIFAEHHRLLESLNGKNLDEAVDEIPSILPPEGHEVMSRIRRHAELAQTYCSQKVALLKMRTIVPRYTKHLPHATQLRQDLIACRSWQDVERVLSEYTSTHVAGC